MLAVKIGIKEPVFASAGYEGNMDYLTNSSQGN